MKGIVLTACVFATSSFLSFASQNPSGEGVPVQMVVTAEGKAIPAIQAGDVMVYQDKERARVREWVPLQGDRAGLQLTIAIDDGANTNLGEHLAELKKFINAQPATTEVAVGYMRNGMVRVEQSWTTDHALATRAVRLPMGMPGVDASPYLSLSDLIKKWPDTNKRREVLMITSGVDLLGGPPPLDPYLDSAIHNAQRAGVIVYSIYFGGRGHMGHAYWRINWGENYLSQLSEETGGEAYWQGFGNPVSFDPYLSDLQDKLGHQYMVTFLAKAQKKSGFENVKVRSELNHVDLLSADQVYVPGTP